LNINLLKLAVKSMKVWSEQGVQIDICTIGGKAQSFFKSFGGNVVAAVRDMGDAPAAADLLGGVKVMLDAYSEGKIDRLFVVSNEFVNTMTQTPVLHQLLPLLAEANEKLTHNWDYIYEPDARSLLDGLLVRYIESQVYQSVVENKACEMSARMVAMKNATENAGEMIGDLQLLYNKARQAAITQELSEIVSGAAAV
jgi:F-type H+-transporting ATPase subunit gamma